MKELIYVGAFVDYKHMLNKIDRHRRHILPYNCDIPNPHVTLAYKPEAVDPEWFGKEVDIYITGYAHDGNNEAVKVMMNSRDGSLNDLISTVDIPHITLSVSPDSKPVESKHLRFEPTEKIVKLKGVVRPVFADILPYSRIRLPYRKDRF